MCTRAGIGEWDKVAIQFGYGVYPAASEAADLKRVLDTAWEKDLAVHDEPGLRPHPRVDQWNNGTDAGAELTRMMTHPPRRARALRRDGHPEGHADGAAGGSARAALPAPSIRGGVGGLRDRRPELHLRLPRRRPHAGRVGAGGRSSAPRSMRWWRRSSRRSWRSREPCCRRFRRVRPATAGTASCSRATPAAPSTRSRPRRSPPT